ncbi:MAG: Ig-like domain-containing protein, partial [Bacteroidia bacterium]|nr:Ig-like domain-containing protein [Bacteroidia bacterium]
VDYKLNTVTVKLKDTLESNTTYSLNFGKAIKDVNEGNVMKDFTYIFSTGPYIDSLQLKGTVVLAETGKADSTLIVMLHTSSNDSVVIKEKPRYIAKLDSMGNFIFKNLPQATYYLYALKDDGGTLRYFNDKQLFAFADKPITVDTKTEPVILYAYIAAEEQEAPSSSSSSSSLQGLSFNNRNRANNTAENRLKYQTNLNNKQQDLLSNFKMTFDKPLRLFDSSKINLYADSTFTPVEAYRFVLDSSSRKLELITTWKENTSYHLIMDKDFADDSSGNKLLKTDTLSFLTNKLSDYGSVKLKLHHLDLSKNPVLQFIAGNSLYKSYPLSSEDFSESLFLPGDYELRLLFDDNKNGQWDPGDFFVEHRQPEIVKPFSRHTITIKKSWENEFDLESPQ